MQQTIPANDAYISSYVSTTPSTGPFQVDFPFFSLNDVIVTAQPDGSEVEQVLVRGADYTLTAVTTEDGSYSSGSVSLALPVTSTTITRRRDTTVERLSNFPLQGFFSRLALNAELNRITAVLQELERRFDQLAFDGLRIPELPAADVLGITDLIEIAQGGLSKSAEIGLLMGTTFLTSTITTDMTRRVGPGGDFVEPGDFSDYLSKFVIADSATVTMQLIPGAYVPTKQWKGHPNGNRVKVVIEGGALNGDPLTWEDFEQYNPGGSAPKTWLIDSVLGQDMARVAEIKELVEVTVRALYRVSFDVGPSLAAFISAGGKHCGDWTDAPVLVIGTPDNTEGQGASTGSGTSAYADGEGAVINMPGSCMMGFKAGWVTDGGGQINIPNSLTLFALEEGVRLDFAGFVYDLNAIVIGCGQYGMRCNHGGSIYAPNPYMRGNQNAGVVDNSPGMMWLHGLDCQFNFTGVRANYNGSLKAAATADFQGKSTAASGTGTIATITFDSSVVIPVGTLISVLGIEPAGYGTGQEVVTASAAGQISYASTQTGPQTTAGDVYVWVPSQLKNNARSQVTCSDFGAFDLRLIDMQTTATFPASGGAAAPPPYGIEAPSGGFFLLNDSKISGHTRNAYMAPGSFAKVDGATIAGGIEAPADVKLRISASSGILSAVEHVKREPRRKNADFALGDQEDKIVNIKGGSDLTVTLPTAADSTGQEVWFNNTVAFAILSASANVIPLTGGAPANVIVPAGAGKWSLLSCDGTNWATMAAG